MLNLKDLYFIIPEISDNLHFNKLSDKEYILSNVTNKHYLKINSDVYDLLELIDGKKNIMTITDEYNKLNFSKVKVEEIYSLLFKKLVFYGIIKGHDQNIKEYQKPSYLKLSFIMISEKNLDKVTKNLHFLFNKRVASIILSSFFVIMAILLYYNFSLIKIFNIQETLIYFFIIMVLSVTFHEIGHATAASYFGAKCGGIGGGFYLFRPVYFADVTDVWRLSTMERVVVNLSGMYFEILFCTIMSIIAFFTNNYVLLAISMIVCIKTFFNLNPFIRSDGYWILSDALEKPNLMTHGFTKIKQIFQSKKSWNNMDYIILGYGLVCYSFVLFFVYFVLIKNPDSILYFPQNATRFIKNLLSEKGQFLLAELGKLLVPLLFFSLIIKLFRNNISYLLNLLKGIIIKFR